MVETAMESPGREYAHSHSVIAQAVLNFWKCCAKILSRTQHSRGQFCCTATPLHLIIEYSWPFVFVDDSNLRIPQAQCRYLLRMFRIAFRWMEATWRLE